jgi:SAM-dependent methyltransferase
VELKERIAGLAPWHLDVEVGGGLSTAAGVENGNGGVSFVAPRDYFRDLVTEHVGSLEGKRFLDCACNCGGYSFWARELGASECFGFDVREHWIAQARFLAEQRGETNVRFEVCDLYELPELQPFDVTLFKGIFYHLPDPISALKIVADLTRETLILNTATRSDYPDGVLVPTQEATDFSMNGVHGLCWYPSGPKALEPLLRWLGFSEITVTHHVASAPPQPEGMGRLELVARR